MAGKLGLTIRDEIYTLNYERLCEFADRARKKEEQGLGEFAVICIDADDPSWKGELGALMPGYDFQKLRDLGQQPFGRGVIPREIAEGFVSRCPEIKGLPPGVHILICGGGGLSIYPVTT